MVDIRQLNPQQLTEVSQRMDQELAVLQGKHLELRFVSRVAPKFNGKGRKKNCFDPGILKNGCFLFKILIFLS